MIQKKKANLLKEPDVLTYLRGLIRACIIYMDKKMSFELHPSLAKKALIADLPLCKVLIQDEKHYPWLILVPQRPHLSRTIDLTDEDQMQLMKELNLVQKILWSEFHPAQLNVAAIGNKIPQLHIHVIVRYADDPAWPNTVWDHPVRAKYEQTEIERLIQILKAKIHEEAESIECLNSEI